jgi:hypothetical protein
MGFDFDVSATMNFSFGAETTISDDALVVGDLLSTDNTTATGFDMTVTPLPFNIEQATGTTSAGFFSQPVFKLGFNILDGTLGFETALKLDLPIIEIAATAIYDEFGACTETPGELKTGLEIAADAALQLWFSVDNDGTVDQTTLYQKRLWDMEYPLLDLCYPIEIPGRNRTVAGDVGNAINSNHIAVPLPYRSAPSRVHNGRPWKVRMVIDD